MSTRVKTVSIAEVYGLRKTRLSNRNKRPFSGKRVPTLHASKNCIVFGNITYRQQKSTPYWHQLRTMFTHVLVH